MTNRGNKCPVETGEIIELSISGMNHQGEGVGRYQGLAVFVPFSLPEDRVAVRVEELKSSYARGKLIRYLNSSSYRTESQCSLYGDCGGCHLQHYDYSRQLEFKQDMVRNALMRIGKLEEVKVLPTIGMQNPYAYRNKAEYPVKLVEGRHKSGFFASMSNRLVVLEEMCPIQHPLLEKAREGVMKICRQGNLARALVDAGFKRLIIRCGQNTGEVMVIFVVDKPVKDFSVTGSVTRMALRQLVVDLPKIVSIYQKVDGKAGSTHAHATGKHFARKQPDSKHAAGNHAQTSGKHDNHKKVAGQQSQKQVDVGDVKYELIEGKAFMREKINGLNFDISPGSFFQVNSTQAEVLFSKAVAYANCKGIAVDAYCGTGSISLSLAKEAEQVYGIESFPAAVSDARRNAAINRIENAQFFIGDAGKILDSLTGVEPEVVVIDPPRAGCDSKALNAITKLHPERIVYVSCNPATLARDLRNLVSKGYSVIEAQPIDMFPQTTHVETVALMSRL